MVPQFIHLSLINKLENLKLLMFSAMGGITNNLYRE